jgi:hypothetical protein
LGSNGSFFAVHGGLGKFAGEDFDPNPLEASRI